MALLMFNQPLFASHATAISTKITIAINDTVTGDDNIRLIGTIGICNCRVSFIFTNGNVGN
jgi:hypothetical protein